MLRKSILVAISLVGMTLIAPSVSAAGRDAGLTHLYGRAERVRRTEWRSPVFMR